MTTTSTPQTPTITVMCVDDHPLVRKGIASILATEASFKVVGEAGNGREAVEMYRDLRPDVVLMDLRMPEMDGIEATKQIRKIEPEAKIIALTSYDGDQDIYKAIEAGVRGYILKEMVHTKVIDAKASLTLYFDYLSRGIAYAKKGQNDLALADFDAAVKLKPDDADSLFRRGSMRLSLKQYDGAIEDLTGAIKGDDKNAMAYRLRGFAYNTQGKDTLAAPDYDKACALNKELCM